MRLFRYFLSLVGLVCLGLGAVGVFVPVLPTTPFLLLSAACFARSSPKLDAYFKSTKLYKAHLEEFIQKRELTRQKKAYILMLTSIMLIACLFTVSHISGQIVIVGVIIWKYWYFLLRIKTKTV